MNVALLLPKSRVLPKSGVQVRRRLGRRDAVPWPRGRSRTQTRSVSASGSVPLHSPNFVQLPSRSRSISQIDVPEAEMPFGLGSSVRGETRVTIYGKTFTQPFFGRVFAPLRHNWMYSVKPTLLSQMIVMGDIFSPPIGGMTQAINHFNGITLPLKTKHADTTDVAVLQQRFVDDWIPALDAGMKRMSVRGNTVFLLELLMLGLHLGVSPGFLFYVLFQIASTEGFSFLIDHAGGEMNGNSMFGYSNYAVAWMLVYKGGFKISNLVPLLIGLHGLGEFFQQFRVQAASKGIHFLGLFLGWLGYLFFL